jgi:four helix bundle protein
MSKSDDKAASLDDLPKIDHERLDVYQAAKEFLVIAHEAVESLPSSLGNLQKQMIKAASSIPLNIAEGTGRNAGKDRSRFLRYADGSARECAAILDVIHACDALEPNKYRQGKELLVRIVSMLTRMA